MFLFLSYHSNSVTMLYMARPTLYHFIPSFNVASEKTSRLCAQNRNQVYQPSMLTHTRNLVLAVGVTLMTLLNK